ncbi:MAG: tryptophan synthase subunit alpha [Myxococcaceae bacterium]|nr:tryptophan synthase subunit alpha [Myxococcaceae bacterium]MCI0673758.1 tryptophan synthase subunit alpha [Myxococcaceae bacterium]
MTRPDRLHRTFAALRARGETALVTYVMAGDPDLATSARVALACVEGGADVLELGFPFSDPVADGPTLQRASERALASGTTLAGVLEVAGQLRRHTDVPIALMGYLNPVLAMGEERFVERCAAAGVDAVILPDLPPEEAEGLCARAAARGIAVVFLLAPTSDEARVRAAASAASGFLYYVSVTGVTGARTELPADVGAQLSQVRAASPVPVVVGFGVSSPSHVQALAPHADGVVVGSAIASRVAEGGTPDEAASRVRAFVASLKSPLQSLR